MMKRSPQFLAIILIVLLLSTCGGPLLLTGLSQSLSLLKDLDPVAVIDLEDIYYNSITEGVPYTVPLIPSSENPDEFGMVHTSIDGANERAEVYWYDDASSVLPGTSSNLFTTRNTSQEILNYLTLYYPGTYEIYGFSYSPYSNITNTTALAPVSAAGKGDGLLVFNYDTGTWLPQVSIAYPFDDGSVYAYRGYSEATNIATYIWDFDDPAGTGGDGLFSADGGTISSGTQTDFIFYALDADSPASDHFDYLFYYAPNQTMYEVQVDYDFDLTIDTMTPGLQYAEAPGTDSVLTRVIFPVSSHGGLSQKYDWDGIYRVWREDGNLKSYYSVIDAERENYVTFTWTPGAVTNITDAEVSLLTKNDSPIEGKLIHVFSDGTLMFDDPDGGWIFYREADDVLKRFKGGDIYFNREFVDKDSGEYMTSLYTEYLWNEYNDSITNGAQILTNEVYVLSTKEFLDRVGM